MTKTRTAFVCTVLVLAVAIYDVVAIQLGGIDASVSVWFNSFARYPAVVFGCGYLAGHWFGMMTPKEKDKL